MLDNIHAHWKRRRVCKIKCKGVCTVDMDNVRDQLEVLFHDSSTSQTFPFLDYNYVCDCQLSIVNTIFELLIMNDRKEPGGRLFLVKVE